jgi:hypothetical protein
VLPPKAKGAKLALKQRAQPLLTATVIAYLDLNVGELLSVVNTDDAADHLRDDDHVTEVGLDGLGLLTNIGVGGSLALSKLLDESNVLSLQATSKTSANAAGEQLDELLVVHLEEVVQVDSAVGVLLENSLLLTLTLVLSLRNQTKMGKKNNA